MKNTNTIYFSDSTIKMINQGMKQYLEQYPDRALSLSGFIRLCIENYISK